MLFLYFCTMITQFCSSNCIINTFLPENIRILCEQKSIVYELDGIDHFASDWYHSTKQMITEIYKNKIFPFSISIQFLEIGVVTSIECNHKQVESARKGQEICIKIEPIPGESPKMFGRHFEETDMLVSKVSHNQNYPNHLQMQQSHFRSVFRRIGFSLLLKCECLLFLIFVELLKHEWIEWNYLRHDENWMMKTMNEIKATKMEKRQNERI